MSLLVARIDHALTRGINWLTTCLVERARGYDSSEAGDYLGQSADDEAEEECSAPLGCTVPGCVACYPSSSASRCPPLAEPLKVLITDLLPPHIPGIVFDSSMFTQTPEAGQPGENPAGVTPETPAGSRLDGWERELIDPAYATIMATIEAHLVTHFALLDAYDCPCGERFYFAKDWRYHLGESIADALSTTK